MEALNHDQVKLSTKCIGQMLSCDNRELIDLLLFNGLLDKYEKLLHEHQDPNLIKEILWSLSNLTAGSEDHQRSFLSNHSLVEKVYML